MLGLGVSRDSGKDTFMFLLWLRVNRRGNPLFGPGWYWDRSSSGQTRMFYNWRSTARWIRTGIGHGDWKMG